jgi:hypothetical protein
MRGGSGFCSDSIVSCGACPGAVSHSPQLRDCRRGVAAELGVATSLRWCDQHSRRLGRAGRHAEPEGHRRWSSLRAARHTPEWWFRTRFSAAPPGPGARDHRRPGDQVRARSGHGHRTYSSPEPGRVRAAVPRPARLPLSRSDRAKGKRRGRDPAGDKGVTAEILSRRGRCIVCRVVVRRPGAVTSSQSQSAFRRKTSPPL